MWIEMTTSKRPTSYWYKILTISQAHLSPGMCLDRWQQIIADYLPANIISLTVLTSNQADEIIRRIDAIINEAKIEEQFDPAHDDIMSRA